MFINCYQLSSIACLPIGPSGCGKQRTNRKRSDKNEIGKSNNGKEFRKNLKEFTTRDISDSDESEVEIENTPTKKKKAKKGEHFACSFIAF